MKKSREELTAELDQLEAELPVMLQQYGDVDIMEAFAGSAEMIEHHASEVDRGFVHSRLQCILRNGA